MKTRSRKRGIRYGVDSVVTAILTLNSNEEELNAFLEDCRKEGHTMTVSEELRDLAIPRIEKIAGKRAGGITTSVASPGGCPSAPYPGRR